MQYSIERFRPVRARGSVLCRWQLLVGGFEPVYRFGARAGDAGIVIATKAHRDELNRRLEALGLDTARSAAQGRFVSLDAQETLAKFMVDGWPD